MEEDIKFMIRDLKAMGYNLHFINQLENLLKAYKEKEIGTKKDKEKISSLCYELGKYMAKSEEDEAVIEEMAERINMTKQAYKTTFSTDYSIGRVYMSKEEKIEYFRNKAKENKE